jgi:hypothetical protein
MAFTGENAVDVNKFPFNPIQAIGYDIIAIGSCLADGVKLAFGRYLFVDIRLGEFGFEAKIPQMNICEFGDTTKECIENLYDAIAFRWCEYAQEQDEVMDGEARRIADFMRDLITV